MRHYVPCWLSIMILYLTHTHGIIINVKYLHVLGKNIKSINRPIYSCFALSDLEHMNGCEAADDLVLIQTSMILSCKLSSCNSNESTLKLL